MIRGGGGQIQQPNYVVPGGTNLVAVLVLGGPT